MLSDSIESARDSRAKSYSLGLGESAADSMKSEDASSGFASASDSFSSETASFPLRPKDLHQHLMHWNPSMQVFPISKGDCFFASWRYLLSILVPGLP